MVSSNIVVIEPAFLPEARRLGVIARRTRRDAEHACAVTQLADNAVRAFLEQVTGLELPDNSYQFDAEKGYLIPKVAESTEPPVVANIASDAPISIESRRRSRKRSN